jgi:hypothetical protein
MPALPDSGSFHGDFAGRKTDLVCCRRKKAVGRRKRTGVRKTSFRLGSGAGRRFCFWSGASGPKFPLGGTSPCSLNCTFPFLDVGGWSRGKLSLNGTGAGTAYQALGGSLVASNKKSYRPT